MSYKHRTKCDACIEFISGKIETNKMASKIFCLGHDSWRGKWKPLYASYSTFLSLCLSISHFRHVYYLDWIIIIIPIQWSLPFPFSCSWIPCPAGSIAVAPFFVQIVHLMAFWMPKIDWQRMHALYADNLTIFRVWDLDHHLPCHCYGHRHKTDCYPFITNITNKHAHSKFTRSLRLEFRQFAMLIISNPFQKLNYIKLMTVYGFSFIFVCCATTEWQFWANVSFTLTHFTSLRFRILLRSHSLSLSVSVHLFVQFHAPMKFQYNENSNNQLHYVLGKKIIRRHFLCVFIRFIANRLCLTFVKSVNFTDFLSTFRTNKKSVFWWTNQ